MSETCSEEARKLVCKLHPRLPRAYPIEVFTCPWLFPPTSEPASEVEFYADVAFLGNATARSHVWILGTITEEMWTLDCLHRAAHLSESRISNSVIWPSIIWHQLLGCTCVPVIWHPGQTSLLALLRHRPATISTNYFPSTFHGFPQFSTTKSI